MQRRNVILVVVLMAASYVAGHWRERPAGAAAPSAPPKILYYHDPMHPEYRSDKPGIAPDCGMDLTPVYAEAAAPQAPAEATPPGLLRISPEKQQVIGVRLGEAEKTSAAHTLRTLGRVAPDEARVFRLTAKVDGWIRRIYPASTGSLVRKGQPLVAVYSRDFQTTQQAYIFALTALDRFKNGDEPDARDRLNLALSEARINLENLGMSPAQIEAIGRTRKALQEVDLVAPAAGFITARNVYADQRFDKGMDLYRIVDLSRVWILADVFERESHWIHGGAAARITLPQLRGLNFDARVSQVLPQFDNNSRTLKVRLEVENPRFALKPDMYADVEFPIRAQEAVVVPEEAVLDSGLGKSVFVARGEGLFEPRTVETGWRLGGRVEIIKGLSAGERIVVSGNFLVDSESRLKLASGARHD